METRLKAGMIWTNRDNIDQSRVVALVVSSSSSSGNCCVAPSSSTGPVWRGWPVVGRALAWSAAHHGCRHSED